MVLLKHWRYIAFMALALLLTGAVAAACSSSSNNEQGASGSPAASSAAGQRAQGGSITVHSLEFQSLDPHYSNFSQDIAIHRMVWRGLYMLDKDNKVKPMMASGDPQVSQDGKTYTIKLKSGLKWSDGQPLTAKDFEAGLKRTCNPVVAGQYEYVLDQSIAGCADFYSALGTKAAPKSPSATELKALEDAVGAKATDDSTLVVKLNQPQPTFKILLALWMTFPVPTHLAQFSTQTPDKPGDWGTDPTKLAYNGPYIIKNYVQQDHVTLVPNPNWAGDLKPTLDQVTVKFIEDNAVADNAFRSGELDEALVDLAQLGTIKTEFGPKYFQNLQPATTGLEMEVKKAPLDNEDVRIALSQSIDRKALNDVVYHGAQQPTTTWLPAVTGGPPPDAFQNDTGFNPTSAKQHLAKAGYKTPDNPGGKDFPTLKMTYRDTPTNQNLFSFLQKAFKDNLGVNIEADVVDSKTRSQKFNTHDFQLFPGGWIQDYPDPENWIVGLFDTGGGNNGYECSNPQIDDLVKKAQFDTNNDERLNYYTQINKLVVTTVCGIAPYYHQTNNWLISDKIVGMKETSAGQDSVMPGDWDAEAWGIKK